MQSLKTRFPGYLVGGEVAKHFVEGQYTITRRGTPFFDAYIWDDLNILGAKNVLSGIASKKPPGEKIQLLGGGFTYFLFSPRKLGQIPILTSIFFRWVETTNQVASKHIKKPVFQSPSSPCFQCGDGRRAGGHKRCLRSREGGVSGRASLWGFGFEF